MNCPRDDGYFAAVLDALDAGAPVEMSVAARYSRMFMYTRASVEKGTSPPELLLMLASEEI